MENIQKQVAIVTGGAKGYGRGIAQSLKDEGCIVYITGRNKQTLEQTGQEIGVEYIVADVGKDSDWEHVFQRVMTEQGRVDILVNNAGAGVAIKNIDEQTPEEIASSVNINLLGTIYGCRRAALVMKEQKSGIIINISSICEEHAWDGWSVYSATKAGIHQFSKCLHVELRPYNIRITNLMPSWGNTGFNENADLGTADDAVFNEKVMQIEDMGELVAHICKTSPNLVIPNIRIQPLIQEINPF